MSELYNIVPWYDSNEWKNVYNKIFSETASISDKVEAHNLLRVWKARCPSLPAGIESTLTLLEVHLEDVKASENPKNDHVLRLAYSSAIMRFVNHTLDTETSKGRSLYNAAKSLGLPDWVIDLRHDAAHNNKLPSLDIFREASSIGLDWLHKKYWNEYKNIIQDYVTGQKNETIPTDNNIEALLSFCVSLSICSHSSCKVRNLSDLPDNEMRESIVNDARDLFGNQVDFSKLKTISILSLINLMNPLAKKFLKVKDAALHVNKAILGENGLFLSIELFKLLDRGGNFSKAPSKHYVQCFEVLLTFLHKFDLLLDFLVELIRITHTSDDDDRCKLTALWISEILKALRRNRQFLNKVNKTNPEDFQSKNRKELKSLFHHWFPNEKPQCLLLDLHKNIPGELSDLHFIQPIISTYNPYLSLFIHDLLNLLEPQLPRNIKDQICALARLISSPGNNTTVPTKIFTVDDLNHEKDVDPQNSDDDDSDCVELYNEDGSDTDDQCQIPTAIGIWTVASSQHDWANCPIGCLPWQRSDIPMDTSEQ